MDLRSLHGGSFIGSVLSGVGNLDPQSPVAQKADLASWYRFEKPGHYELRVSSSEVSLIKSAEEGGGLEPIALESNPVAFEVLAGDAALEAQEVGSAVEELGGDPAAHAQAIHRLGLIDCPASISKLVTLFLADAAPLNDTPAASGAYDETERGLEESGHPELIIPLLEAALGDPQRTPGANLVDLLAALQVRREFGPPGAVPVDPDRKKEWDAAYAKRNRALRDYMGQATEKLLASLRQRSGPQRSVVLFQAWSLAERRNESKEQAPATLVQLRQEVLASARELPLADLMSFVTQSWNWTPREKLVPLVRYVALSAGRLPKDQRAGLQLEDYPLWCEESPRECDDAILADAVKPDSPILPNIILLLKESEHPELDALLKERVAAAATLKDYLEAQKTGALLLRAGSRNLRPAVREALAQLAGKRAADCEVRAYPVNYLVRFAPKDATQYLRAAFQDKESFCGWFGFLGQTRSSDDLIPIAMDALDSPNVNSAVSAALFLGAHGPPDAEDVLWRHLDSFWDQWHSHAAELELAAASLSGSAPAARLEQALVNALVHGVNWKLALAEQDRLRAGCLTNDCRKVATGQMSLGN